MKQINRDMHSAMMGEVGDEAADSRDVFLDLGVLIVEGRTPGGQSAAVRGYGEGPHCVRQSPAVSRHDCDDSFMCQRAENLRKHMQLLWENSVPMCVEVLLCGDCPCGAQKAQCPEIANVPSQTDLLLEQWMITMIAKKGAETPQMTARGLLQAVRSQLHFSQLSAWWSSSKGANPAHVNYRVTVPSEAFASQFRSTPSVHSFPVATVSRNTSIKVSVRTLPRMESVPKVFCNVHHNAEAGAVGGVAEETPSRNDTSLGECLLDPPQSLDHFSRKYQSPSRGSPSVEAPDHLLFPRCCRRESSPPSPPMSFHQHRRGREGLARRRDASWKSTNSELPGMVDDRMQNPCNRSGKHDCRCDDELEPLPSRRGKPLTTSKECPIQSRQRSTSPPTINSSKDVKDDSNGSSQYLSGSHNFATDKAVYLPWCPPANVGPKETDALVKQCKRVKKEVEECDGKTTGSKLNLELSPREFEEVLSVLRDRTSTLPHHGTKSLSRSPDDQLSSKMLGYKMQCQSSRHRTQLVYNVQTSSQPKPEATGKADLFMEAILRSSDNNGTPGRSTQDSEKDSLNCDEISCDLSNKISKISLDNRSKKSSFTDSCVNSGTKRKRFESKSSSDVEEDSSGDPHRSDKSLDHLVFEDNLRSTRDRSVVRDNQNHNITCLSRNIDERTLSNEPRTFKINKKRSDLCEKVPCDAVDGKKTKCLNSVINDGDSDGERTGEGAIKSDITESEDVSAPESSSNNETISIDTKETEKHTKVDDPQENLDRPVPSASEKEKFRRNLDFAASMVFHSRTGLPLTSSPAPVRRNATCFDYDSTITSVSAIRSALFESTPSDDNFSLSSDDAESEGRSPCSPRIPVPPVRCMWSRYTHLASSLLGTFEESVLNGRLEPVSTVQGFTANLGASGSFCPRHVTLPVTVFFYTLGDNDKVSTPYLAHINLGKKGYNVPRCGTIQVTLFNPLGTVVKMFVVMYDLTDMPANSQTFLRQRTLYLPANTDNSRQPDNFQKWLRYLVHLRFSSSKSGRVYLHSDIRMIIFRKSDLDTATAHGVDMSYELRSFTHGPTNPKFSSRK